MPEILYIVYDKKTDTIWSVYETHGQAYAELRNYAAVGEVIINDTVRSGVCIKTMSVFEAIRLLLVGKQVNL